MTQRPGVLGPATAAALARAGLDPASVLDLVGRAVAEDLDGGEDVTSVATVPADLLGVAAFVPRADGTLAGLGVAMAVLDVVVPGAELRALAADGDPAVRGRAVLEGQGPVRSLLTAERTALNLLCHLSGVATLTAAWVEAVAGTGARIRDTRKTTPGLRALEKHAVRCGGGVNHRMSLSDAALVKDNHVVAAGGVGAAFTAVRERFPGVPVEVECDTVEQVREVLEAGADLVLLDNMTTGDLRASVALCRAAGVLTEASGGLSLDVARSVAETGVDFLAVGALTHSAPVLDLGVDLRTI
jgi:nicotinate-nucleotide pyrophosphorylase (carboxylating)